ncbi:hypothetical protein B296_00003232 [Ensete ventricosum]|uniref:Tubby C-terminal domain-containing protein n=1 Tax=Ensete ventricosum TaxID=4639 RepID=A0A427AX25_ENSVE|nr:hypothetical protein B296_00003232 [Ensete ventricosum]
MSFKSIIQDLRDELGSISRKGFELKMGHGLRSRSHRVVHDALDPPLVGALRQSCWANMPPELLRDVLVRIEEGEGSWPVRKDVVACAGVCLSWRDIMKEIVKTPELSGKLTFPISLKQWCIIILISIMYRSNFLGTKFTVYDAQPPHAGATVSRSQLTRIIGPKQVSPRVPAGNYPVAHIAYELNVLGSR